MGSRNESIVSEDLIPIRLELNVDGHTVTETFTWNRSEQSVTPSDFAAMLAADLSLPAQAVAGIASSLVSQIEAFSTDKYLLDPTALSSLPNQADLQTLVPEARHVLRINVRVGRVVLRDQFEWDIVNPENSPEAFAFSLCADVGLGSEFVPAIAHAIREQLAEFLSRGDPGSSIAAGRRRLLEPVLDPRNALRKVGASRAWEPTIECLNMSQQHILERKERREARIALRNRLQANGIEKPPNRKYRRRSLPEGS